MTCNASQKYFPLHEALGERKIILLKNQFYITEINYIWTYMQKENILLSFKNIKPFYCFFPPCIFGQINAALESKDKQKKLTSHSDSCQIKQKRSSFWMSLTSLKIFSSFLEPERRHEDSSAFLWLRKIAFLRQHEDVENCK